MKRIDYLKCDDRGTTTPGKITDKINELVNASWSIDDCCDYWGKAEEIKSLLVGDMVFLTGDGTDPVPVPLPDPIPETHTIFNHGEMLNIYFNHVRVKAMFFDGVLVYYQTLELVLPQYNDTFSLEEFIDKKLKELGYGSGTGMNLRVINNLVQPTMKTGSLTRWGKVTFINNGEITGTRPSDDGLIFESKMYLENNGWIKGAGGNGVKGANGSGGVSTVVVKDKVLKFNTSSPWYGQWRARYNSGVEWLHCDPHDPRYKECHDIVITLQEHRIAKNHNVLFPWRGTENQKPWYRMNYYTIYAKNDPNCYNITDVTFKSAWGKSIRVVRGTVNIGSPNPFGIGYNYTMYYQAKEGSTTGQGGAGGSAGVGQSFKTKRTDGGKGQPGRPSPDGGAHGQPGKNGTRGGDWGEDGGPPGDPAGRAIVGIANMENAADGYGNVIGAVV